MVDVENERLADVTGTVDDELELDVDDDDDDDCSVDMSEIESEKAESLSGELVRNVV